MKGITPIELSELINSATDLQLIDVRELDEHEAFNIGGLLIPLGQIMAEVENIEKEKPVIVYCRKGIRSQIAIQRLQNKYQFDNLINLTGGTDTWKKEFPL